MTDRECLEKIVCMIDTIERDLKCGGKTRVIWGDLEEIRLEARSQVASPAWVACEASHATLRMPPV